MNRTHCARWPEYAAASIHVSGRYDAVSESRRELIAPLPRARAMFTSLSAALQGLRARSFLAKIALSMIKFGGTGGAIPRSIGGRKLTAVAPCLLVCCL